MFRRESISVCLLWYVWLLNALQLCIWTFLKQSRYAFWMFTSFHSFISFIGDAAEFTIFFSAISLSFSFKNIKGIWTFNFFFIPNYIHISCILSVALFFILFFFPILLSICEYIFFAIYWSNKVKCKDYSLRQTKQGIIMELKKVTWWGDWGCCEDGLHGAPASCGGCCDVCWGPGLWGGGAWVDDCDVPKCGPGLAAGDGHYKSNQEEQEKMRVRLLKYEIRLNIIFYLWVWWSMVLRTHRWLLLICRWCRISLWILILLWWTGWLICLLLTSIWRIRTGTLNARWIRRLSSWRICLCMW